MANLTPQAATLLMDGTPMPTTFYAQIHIGDPTVSGNSNVAAGNTARKSFTRTAAANGLATNANLIQWIPYTVNETITHVSVWDSLVSGVCWWVGALDAPVAALISDSVYFIIGSLELELTHY